MIMSNSTLVNVSQMNHSNYSNYSDRKIDKIIIHHSAGIWKTAQNGLDYFSSKDAKQRTVSCHYVIGNDGSIGQSVDEKYRSWCSGGKTQDYNSVTIEVSNSDYNWNVSEKAYQSLVKLVADIAKRNNLTLERGKTVFGHRDFANTICPGPYLYPKLSAICTEATKLNNTTSTTTNSGKLYRVQVGAFSNKNNAEKMVADLKSKGYSAIIVEVSKT